PNRRLNESVEIREQFTDRPVIHYTYDCNGPNIDGLHVTRTLEPLPNEASVRVKWRIENTGSETHWVAPWVRSELSPGGSVSAADRLDIPAFEGIVQPKQSAYYRAARNWAAATDPAQKETVYVVTGIDDTFAFLALNDQADGAAEFGYETAFVPRMMKPGETWETTYRLNLVRGLDHVDFATDELAAQIDYKPGTLTLLLAPVRAMSDIIIDARVVAPNGRVWKLAGKRFDINPHQLARCTYEWDAPEDGAYEFMAQLQQRGSVVRLGSETGSPHGGIDTQFVVGPKRALPLEAWSDAPYALARSGRTLDRTLAHDGSLKLWFESPMEKIFKNDVPRAKGATNNGLRLAMARNERESFQIILHPEQGEDLFGATLAFNDLVNETANARISASDIKAFRVGYQDVRIPTYFEGPTGEWPDILQPLTPFLADGGRNHPLWITVFARPGLPAGEYRGIIEIQSADRDPVELWLTVEVYDFELPATPNLKTDVGFTPEVALQKATGSRGEVFSAYLNNALEHRITIRDLAQLPPEGPEFSRNLASYAERLQDMRNAGATTFAVPAALLQTPQQLQKANDFVVQHGLQKSAFTHLAADPLPPAWPRLLETMEVWNSLAPDVPVMITSSGITPFLHKDLDIWNVHAQVLDSSYGQEILQRVLSGGEVWWHFNQWPSRPYPNFFLDFAGIEHRIIFWQSWALGIRGLHYWNVNFVEADQNPYNSLLDTLPTNGDGFLLYPGERGPINSIRWEIIRDGIEDYDYLTLLKDRFLKAQGQAGKDNALRQASQALELQDLVPNLVNFTRDPEKLAAKRAEIARAIVALGDRKR
ncbi:MAG: DUF4091 domain-containing protein, partial [Candidatus Hydrogenedentes bacterium]|nr:DUF4091 domain-containing protein [Candidatus Hydrogenedentota bacterium]